jgi:hypothetical protein
MSSADTRLFAYCRQIWWRRPSAVQTIRQEFTDNMPRTKTTKDESSANLGYEAQLWRMADRNRDGLDAEMHKHLSAEGKRGESHADERCFSGTWA